VTDAATAPLPTIGPISDIDADVQFRDRTVRIEAVKAQVGGAPIVIHGGIDFSDWKAETKRWPAVRLRVAGTNIALVRESQKIIRTDLDLQITNAARGTPSIGGVVNLRDSLFLAELANLVPSGVRKPSQRPPYFSVDAPLLRDWPLNVRVQGDRFLTVRTPFFRGEASVNLDLRGNLEAPLAVGDVRLNTGTISFPFATLSVKQGFVTLSSANPYDPQLFVTAAGRAYDFDIRLEMTGSAQSPILAFTSVPPLTSEQILLLVTSGQVPRTDYSLSTQQRAQGVGIFVGKSFMSQLGLGGSGENLTIRSGESISERGRSTYSVEYKLTEDVSLVGEYDRFDEYNAGVKWRIFSK
jgi:translocation and assembly module TamB